MALKHLTTYDSILPIELELETREGASKLRRMIPCISILSTAIVVAKEKIQLKKVLIERLSNQDAVDALCRWATFCLFTHGLRRGASTKYVVSYETIVQSSRAISTLLHLDASLPRQFLPSTDFMDFVIHAWMDILERSNELFIDLDDPFIESCPVLQLLQVCLSVEDSRRALLDRLEVNGHLHSLPSSFIRQAQQLSVERASRAQQLGLADNAPGTVHHRAADYLFELLDTLHKFLTHFPSVRQRFLAANYMGELMKTLEAILARVETTQAGVPRQYLNPFSILLVHAAEQSTRGVLYWRDLVAAGLIPLLGRTLIPVTGSETQPRTIGTHLVETLSLFTVYPAVLKIISATDSSVLSKDMNGYDALSNAWETPRYRCLDAGRVFRATGNVADVRQHSGMSPVVHDQFAY
jgi:hypothetical protein